MNYIAFCLLMSGVYLAPRCSETVGMTVGILFLGLAITIRLNKNTKNEN